MMEEMTNMEFQDRVNIGDKVRLSASHKHSVEFLGYLKCDSTNRLCKGCKGHIKYYSPNSNLSQNGCFRHGSTVALIQCEIEEVWLKEADFLL